MGLDIAIGIMVLLGAIRGWFRGFLLQAIRLGGLVGSVYVAAPVRGLAKPYVAPYLATIRPDLLDRMLWWASAVICYLVTVGLAGMLVNFRRQRPYGDPDVSRADQSAGFLLEAAKSAVIAAFLVASLDKYASSWLQSVPWANEQSRDSMVLAWERQYRPAEKIWTAPPVQQFVAYVRKMGMTGGVDLGEPANLLGQQLLPKPAADLLTPLPPPDHATAEVPPRNPRLGLPSIGDNTKADLLPSPNATEDEVSAKISQAVDKIMNP